MFSPGQALGRMVPRNYINVRRSKHGIDSVVISSGGIAPQGPLSLHTVEAHFC